jgi:spore germination protein YaaH
MRKIASFVFGLSIFVIVSSNAFAQTTSTQKLEGLWYYTETPRSRESLYKNIKKINILGPQTYELRNGGAASSTMRADVLELASKNKVKVMPLLANTNGKIFDQKTVLNLLDNPKHWEIISKFMREEAYNNRYIGWQLDLENIPVSRKETFNQFVKYLKGEFDKDGLKLSIAIVSKISDNPSDYDKNYWNNWAGAYDYQTLASSTDFLSVMAYDQPNSPGPVATIGWSKKVLDYAVKNIPANKISFGIPVYGWAYRGTEKKHFTMVDYSFTYTKLTDFKKNDLKNMTTGAGISKSWGNISWVSYNLKGKNYTIWYEDKASFQSKYNQLKVAGVRGYSAWVLGDEDPKIWELF